MTSAPAVQRTVFLLGPERLELRERPVPAPGPGELLVAIGAALTCGTDVKVFRRGGHPRMLAPPCPFGHEMAGTVVACGPPAAGEPAEPPFRPGDRVVVANSSCCGACEQCLRGRENLCVDLRYLNGAFSNVLLVPRRFAARSVHRLPGGLACEAGALAEPLACVLHGLDSCGLQRPSDIALYGAGPIGLLFLGCLVAAGHRVTVADPNTSRLEAALRLGAEAAVPVGRDGGEADRMRRHAEDPSGFDLAIEAAGSPAAWWDALASVRPGGTVLLFGGCPPGTSVPLDTHRLHYSEITVKSAYHHRPATFRRALDMLAAGEVASSVLLSAERPLAETEAALRSMMRKEALKVVLRP